MLDQKLEKYFKEKLKNFLFIELNIKNSQTIKVPSIEVPVPLEPESMTKFKQSGVLTSEQIVESMIFVIGSDNNFMYNSKYIVFLKAYSPKIINYVINRGILLVEEGQLLTAAICFRAALALDQTSLDGKFAYARVCYEIYSDQGQEEQFKTDFKEVALALFEDIISENPTFAGGYYYIGYFYFNAKLYEKAKLVWKKYITLCTENDSEGQAEIKERLEQLKDLVQFEKGYLAVMNGKVDEGILALEPLLLKSNVTWNVMYFVGLAYRRKGDFQKAADMFKNVVMISPSEISAMNELAMCYTHMGDFENAEKYFKKALLLKENDPDILCNLAGLYINAGKLEEGQECLNQVREIAPDDEILKSWQHKLDELKM